MLCVGEDAELRAISYWERGSSLLVNPVSHCHHHRLYQLWANLRWARNRAGMIKLLLVLLLLFLSLFMSPSGFHHSCYWWDTQWGCRKVIWDPAGVFMRLKSTENKAVSAHCRNTPGSNASDMRKSIFQLVTKNFSHNYPWRLQATAKEKKRLIFLFMPTSTIVSVMRIISDRSYGCCGLGKMFQQHQWGAAQFFKV